ncbi:Flp family type IVb pilin [Aquisalibacillus elongatus]|uniref:Pilus assembly protein Flp/PilA n=1 Tax=Aquisalibacillus elongatus TaxID=485577 RepID=A0A3N5BAH4_9BACI|nr:Flp family type IVb pilin [Aquisalibacillus elongatus]RPF53959.1 pilus assembly protein Flp/PilA [Aquisalibacillus elongatus]
MKKFMTNFIREEEGQGMAEYALVLGVIAVGVVAILGTFGGEIKEVFDNIVTTFQEDVNS